MCDFTIMQEKNREVIRFKLWPTCYKGRNSMIILKHSSIPVSWFRINICLPFPHMLKGNRKKRLQQVRGRLDQRVQLFYKIWTCSILSPWHLYWTTTNKYGRHYALSQLVDIIVRHLKFPLDIFQIKPQLSYTQRLFLDKFC
jgi:hypothetical protein